MQIKSKCENLNSCKTNQVLPFPPFFFSILCAQSAIVGILNLIRHLAEAEL